MDISSDSRKREATLRDRGLDFARAGEVFDGLYLTAEDTRPCDELRFISMGTLDERLVVTVWMPRGEGRRIISMRKANEREQKRFHAYFEP